MPVKAVLNFRVPTEPRFASVVRQAVSEFAGANGIGRDDLAHFLTALGEAIANAIEHAHSHHGITIDVRIDRKAIVAKIEDGGIGFTAVGLDAKLPDVDAERGRGLAIMRRCSDIFTISSEPGGGTAIVIGRYLRKASANGSVSLPEAQLA
jgi:anti-sigma regulatory factor (Ser/Thr protein kinase)